MKILTRTTVFSILEIGILTTLLATLMLMGIDLFTNLDRYTTYELSFKTIMKLTFLYFPEASLLAIGPSFLFAVTYYLSMLNANNEYISILNTGISQRRIMVPCVILGFFISLFYFVFNETVAITWSAEKESLYQVSTNSVNTNNYNYKIALSDIKNNSLVYCREYSDGDNKIYDLSVIHRNPEDNSIIRINAAEAVWNQDKEKWILSDVTKYEKNHQSSEIVITQTYETEEAWFDISPQMFRNVTDQVSTMPLNMAFNYVYTMKHLNSEQFAVLGTDFYSRVLSCLTPFVLIIIACSMSFQFRKNVLFFSLISSICIAVVYYVIQIMTVMLASQAVIAPYMGQLIPLVAIIAIASGFSAILRKIN